MVYILIGPPGAGKGTQGRILSEQLQIPFFSSGDYLRGLVLTDNPDAMKVKTLMDKGELIPDELMSDLILSKILDLLISYRGVVLDGYPRTVKQAIELESLLATLGYFTNCIQVIKIACSQDMLKTRLENRMSCPSCRRIYSGQILACSFCGVTLEQRSDDNFQVVKDRLAEYELKTRPLEEHYLELGRMISVEGEGLIQEVAQRISKILKVKNCDCY